MNAEIQFKLKENPLYIKYIRENNIWYKRLIRNPERFDEFIREVKVKYKLRPSDKINNIIETANVISNLISSML